MDKPKIKQLLRKKKERKKKKKEERLKEMDLEHELHEFAIDEMLNE